MPNRIIRESCLSSHSLAFLSDGAERLFWRLTVVADDAGRFDAFPSTVKARCFPTLVDQLATKKVSAWLQELALDHVDMYQVGTKQVGQFRNWTTYQRSYGLQSKYPPPPNSGGKPHATVESGKVPQPTGKSRSYPISENRESRIDIRDLSTSLRDGFARFWTGYPRKVGKRAAEAVWKKLRPSLGLVDVMLAKVDQEKRTAQWTKDGGQFIPHPATWLRQGRWEDEPVMVGQAPARSLVELGMRNKT